MLNLYSADRSEECLAFLQDVVEVMLKHNKSISHEDCHGSFLIEKLNESDLIWFKNAAEVIDKNGD